MNGNTPGATAPGSLVSEDDSQATERRRGQAEAGVRRFAAQLRKDLTPDKFKRHSDYSKATAALDGIEESLKHGFGDG